MKKKHKVELTFEERLNSAHAQAEAAVSTFERMAQDLEVAARDKRDVAADIAAEIDRLDELITHYSVLRSEAEEFARKNETKASNIRALASA